MRDAPYREIPLRNRRGEITAHTLVDDSDFDAMSQHRWFCDGRGYARRHQWIDGKYQAIFLAREIMGLVRGDGLTVDHINRDPLDNRRENLRVVSHAQNQQNRGSYQGSTSRFRGVYWERKKRKWRAAVRLDNVIYRLGYFDDEVEAARAASEYRQRLMPYAQPDSELAKLDRAA